jgi:hypothetical protein
MEPTHITQEEFEKLTNLTIQIEKDGDKFSGTILHEGRPIVVEG